MSKKQNKLEIIRKVKSLVSGADSSEKESVRDELLAYLLFGDSDLTETGRLKGLSENEKELIRKLAEQTEALYKATRENRDGED